MLSNVICSFLTCCFFLSLKNHISDVKIIHFEELVDARTNNASGTDGCKGGKQYKARNNGHGKMYFGQEKSVKVMEFHFRLRVETLTVYKCQQSEITLFCTYISQY